MMSVSNHEYPDIDPTDPKQNVNLRTSKHPGSKSKESKQRKAKNIMLLASMYGAAVGGHSLPGIGKDNPYYHATKAERLIEECKQIKGISAKEMGTSGKKKLSRAQRKKQNGKNNKKK